MRCFPFKHEDRKRFEQHMKSHSTTSTYVCLHCNYSSKELNKMDLHVAGHHDKKETRLKIQRVENLWPITDVVYSLEISEGSFE